MELDPPHGQVITGGDETYSDIASEVDDEYSHEKVWNSLWCNLVPC